MTAYIFASVLLVINGALVAVLRLHRYRRSLLMPVVVLALCAPVLAVCTVPLFYLPVRPAVLVWLRVYGALMVGVGALLVECAVRFMRGNAQNRALLLRGGVFSPIWLLRMLSVGVAAMLQFTVWALPGQRGLDHVFVVGPAGVVFGICMFVNALFTLYVLENTYRSSAPYQRRIGRLCFAALGVIATFLLVFSIRIMWYRLVDRLYIDLSTVIVGVSVIVLLLGLVRYRLGTEHVSISRETVYSSVTLLLVGATLLGLSATVAIGRRFGIAPGHFELYLMVFVAAFFGVLVVSSGSMRIRVMAFINTHFYTHKYDYREQFFRLHRTYMAGSDIEGSVTELVENIKYAVAADDAFVFLVDAQDGVFTMHQNQEFATPVLVRVAGDHPFVALMRETPRGLDLINNPDGDFERRVRELAPEEFATLSVGSFFPIRHQDELVGFLGIRRFTRAAYDAEDIELLNVFTSSIGNVVFKQRMLRERIEHKQFESFTRVASFIIHDIKNQVATLTLLLRNANTNMANPDFQRSLLVSIGDTSRNLQQLVDKLAASRNREGVAEAQVQSINTIVTEAVNATGLETLASLTLEMYPRASTEAQADRGMLFYVVKNLIINALEAMENAGTLRVETGRVEDLDPALAARLGVGPHLLHKRRTYILVCDTGRGMSADFIRNRLFHPFSSTKDKGVGIGLYQCKTLVEKGGGTIRCFSRTGEGTTFCILL